jgi:ComF family protein
MSIAPHAVMMGSMKPEDRALRPDSEAEIPGIVPLKKGFSHAIRVGLDLLLPPRCISCQSSTDLPGELCATCWSEVRFIDDPICAACGFPFEYDLGPGALCAACHTQPPQYARARTVMAYDDHSRGLVLAFKHGDRLEGAPTLARWMARAGRELLADADIIAPVPLHRWRLLSRRYNQSAVLANQIARTADCLSVPDLMSRVRATPSQGGLSRSQRRKNVSGAFAVRSQRRAEVEGRKVLLIDDVMTTGATVDACAKVLVKAGAERVDILTLARVVRGASLHM